MYVLPTHDDQSLLVKGSHTDNLLATQNFFEEHFFSSMKFFSFALLAGPAVSWAFVPTTLHHTRSFSSLNAEVDRRSFSGVAASAAAASVLGPVLPASAALSTQWTQVQIPFTDTLYDIDFDTKDHVSLMAG